MIPAADEDDTDGEAEANGHGDVSQEDDFLEDFPDDTSVSICTTVQMNGLMKGRCIGT